MAIYRNAKFVVGGFNVSSAIRSLAFNLGAIEQDDTGMGDDTESAAGGLKRWTFEAEANQEFSTTTNAFNNVFATRVGTTQTIIFRPFASATALSQDSPKWSGTGLITSYSPVSSPNVGDQFTGSVSIRSAGTLAYTNVAPT
jgi:hypothetical protein